MNEGEKRWRILSGMQPTGELHLGNYLGALANWVELGKTHDCLYCVVDQHALTIQYDVKTLASRTLDFAASYLAAGVDPERSVIFVQSHVPEHTELAWYLSAVTQVGELERMTQYKDKRARDPENCNTGLLTYPVLMAADILLYKATAVPVGEDQVQHLELTRDVAHRFNRRFGETFPLPKPLLTAGARIMGTDGLRKMSKSLGNSIGLFETDKAVWKKLSGAFTDPQRTTLEEPGRPEVCNIFRLHKALSPPELVQSAERDCREAHWGCGHCKKAVAAQLSLRTGPMRERYEHYKARPELLREVLAEGARKARALASQTMDEVRAKMGLR